MIRFWTKVAGTWKQIGDVYVKVGGTWKVVKQIFVKDSGVWKRTYGPELITISSNTSNYNLIIPHPGP